MLNLRSWENCYRLGVLSFVVAASGWSAAGCGTPGIENPGDVGVLGGPIVVKGHSWYMAPGGNDSAAGTINAPWATLEGAASHMAPGDATFLRGGTYRFSSAIRTSGTAGWPITFTAYPGETPTIIGPLGGRSDALEYQGSYIVMDHLRFSNQAPGITVSMNRGTHDNVISNCEIFGSLQSGLIVSGSNNTISGNHIHGNGTHAALDHGIYLEGDHNLVQANRIHDNWTMGIQIYNGYGVTAGNNTIDGNYLYHNGYGSPGVNQTYLNSEIYVGGDNSPNNIIRNNVMCGDAHYAMYFWGNAPGTQVLGNVSCNNGSGGFYLDAPGPGTVLDGNISYNDAGPSLLVGFGMTSDNNTFFRGGGAPTFQWHGGVMSLAAYAQLSQEDTSSTIADPRFAAPPPQGAFSSAAALDYNFCSARTPGLCPPGPSPDLGTPMAAPDLGLGNQRLADMAQPPQANPDLALIKGHLFYMAPGGNDNGAGTIGSPWATLENAAAHMAPGDVTYLRGGTYLMSSAIRSSGTAGSPLTFTAYPGEVPTIIGPQNGRSDALEYQGNYIVMDHLRFSNQAPGITVSMNRGTHHNVISNCEIFGSLQSGLIVSGSNNTVYRNHIHDNGTHAALDHGIYLEGDHNLVQSNRIHDNWTMAIQIYNGYGVTAGSNTIDSNYLYHNGYGSPGVNQTYLNCELYVGGANSPNNIISNNVMCGDAHYAMYFWGNPPGTQVIGNVSCNNGSGGFYLDAPGPGTVLSNNVSYDDAGPSLLMGQGLTSDSNTFFVSGGTPTFQWKGSTMSLSSYAKTSGQDAHSVIADAHFTTAPPKGSFASAAAATYNFCTALIPALCAPRP